MRPLLERAARNYVAGEHVADAVGVAEHLQLQHQLPTTLGYWDADGESPDAVLDKYLEALQSLSTSPLDSYLSIKLPSLDYCRSRLEQVLELAKLTGRRVHFDALGPGTVDHTRAMIDEALNQYDHLRFTLPGRWQRSLVDADWVVDRALPVRVVKGQFPDPHDPDRDRRKGFLAVVERLAGKAKHVSVATHDPAVIEPALRTLLEAGTSCDLEVLYGLAWRSGVATARRLCVPARVYVPYGAAFLPYCLAEARRSPQLLCRALADTIKACFLSPALPAR